MTGSRPTAHGSPTYLSWLRTQPCALLRSVRCVGGRSEAAHTHDGTQGTALKAADRNAIPLCAWCHRLAPDSYHAIGDEAAWAKLHGLHLPAIRKALRHRFNRDRRR